MLKKNLLKCNVVTVKRFAGYSQEMVSKRELFKYIKVRYENIMYVVSGFSAIIPDAPYPHAFKARQGPERPEGSQCPQRFDGGELRVAQSIGYEADQGYLKEGSDRDNRGER